MTVSFFGGGFHILFDNPQATKNQARQLQSKQWREESRDRRRPTASASPAGLDREQTERRRPAGKIMLRGGINQIAVLLNMIASLANPRLARAALGAGGVAAVAAARRPLPPLAFAPRLAPATSLPLRPPPGGLLRTPPSRLSSSESGGRAGGDTDFDRAGPDKTEEGAGARSYRASGGSDLPPRSVLRLRVPDPEDMEDVGAVLSVGTGEGDVVLLGGDLGAGKTCLSRGFVRARTGDEEMRVTSPTYLLSNAYPADGGKTT